MKKLIFILVSMAFLGSSFAFAKPVNTASIVNASFQQSAGVLSSADQNLIFGDQVDAMVLGNDEMKNTQGFGFWSSIGDFLRTPIGQIVTAGSIVGCIALTGSACAITLAF
ncbi:hypothetical protein BKH41_07965 [Helicobacter sp. 12S02232-10]|uniref:hypothetical protein n=1 Tax=Helicobacter sp. 12S02232-10 TaxID=1476197 RepID=UPI000BA513CB|nr:hypothetical protein [Helicobacter sp. 12S02232-10]PAF47207.1 hypothetical protein BKH41_07965 [Helicobacter sp. 12S02232-10]